MEIFAGLEPVYPRCQSPESPSHRPGRVNIERAVSPTADPIPCALRYNLVEDCSHAKLVNLVWRKRQAALDLDPKQRNECPMPTCRQLFNDFHQMITHLQDCPEVVRGLYWCWDCYRTEEFSLCHCRSCKHTWTQSNSTLGNTMKKVTRALSNSLRRSLKGKRARKETSVPPVTPPTETSELFGNAVPNLQPSIAPCDPYSRQQSSQPQPLASSDLWANFASLESIDTSAPQTPLATYAAELPAELATSPGFFFGPSPGQPMPSSSSLSNVSLMSFHSPNQPPRGSLVSLASPRSSVGGSRILSPLSAHPATAGGAAHTPSPLTDTVFCESPTTMEDGGDPSKNFASWAPLHSSSWSSGDTYIAPASDFADAQQPHFPELQGSLPETAALHFQNNLASLESNSFLADSMRPSVKIPAPEGYELPAKESRPEYVQAQGSSELCSSLSSDDRILSQVTQDSLATLSTALQEGTFQSHEGMLGGTSPLDSTTFFQRSVPAVNNACDQSYRVNHDRAGYDGWPVNIMRHYGTDRSRQETGPNEARQNSWSSSSSTTIGCNEPQDLLSAPAKPLLAELPDNTASRPTVRRHGGTITRHRARTIRQGSKKESCPHCDYSREGADRLKLVRRHMKTHQDTEDWFQCGFSSVDGSVCSKGYNRRDNLRAHQRTEKHAHDGKEKRLLRKRLPGGPKYRPLIC